MNLTEHGNELLNNLITSFIHRHSDELLSFLQNLPSEKFAKSTSSESAGKESSRWALRLLIEMTSSVIFNASQSWRASNIFTKNALSQWAWVILKSLGNIRLTLLFFSLVSKIIYIMHVICVYVCARVDMPYVPRLLQKQKSRSLFLHLQQIPTQYKRLFL